jgi:hypothetical protein
MSKITIMDETCACGRLRFREMTATERFIGSKDERLYCPNCVSLANMPDGELREKALAWVKAR